MGRGYIIWIWQRNVLYDAETRDWCGGGSGGEGGEGEGGEGEGLREVDF